MSGKDSRMKASVLLFWVVLATAGLLSGCSGAQKPADTAQVYKCPTCKEDIRWTTQPGKPWITTGKEVVHSCPSCKKEWAANLSTTSACKDCQQKDLVCPICKQHG
jgi:hypothetical protein